MVRYTEQIMEAETKIRHSLVRQGLTAKYSFDDIIGSSRQSEDILMAKRYSRVDSNVLIVGRQEPARSCSPQHPQGEQEECGTLCGLKLRGPA